MASSPFAAPLGAPVFTMTDDAGNPLSGGQVESYITGTSTPLPTYPTFADALVGTNANTNPVILDAYGRAQIWLTTALYKIVVKDSTGAVVWTANDVTPARGYFTTLPTAWTNLSDLTPATFTYLSGTQFQVNGVDVTSTFHPGRRLWLPYPLGSTYGTVVSSSFGTNTVVTVASDSGSINSGLSAVWFGTLSYNNPAYLDPGTVFTANLTGNQTGFAAATKLATWTVGRDALSEWSAVNNRIVFSHPGDYLVQAQAEYADSGTNVDVSLLIYRNGSAVAQSRTRTSATASQVWSVSAQTIVNVTNTTSYVELFFLGTANTTVQGTTGTRFTVTRLQRAG